MADDTKIVGVIGEPKMLDTADSILSVDDAKFENVDVPEWGGSVRIKAMTGEERDAFESSIAGTNGKMNTINIRAKLVFLSVVNSKGERIFNKEQITVLGQKSAAALNRVYTAAAKLSAITSSDVDELAKNSDSGLLADS